MTPKQPLFLSVVLLTFASASSFPFSTLPEQFTMGLEIKLPHYNFTSYGKFYYDKPNERARLDAYGKQTTKAVVDFGKDELLIILGKGECLYRSASDSFMADPENKKELKTPEEIFHMTAKQKYDDLGDTSVRGIPAGHWKTHVTESFDQADDTPQSLHSNLMRHHIGHELRGVDYDLTWYFSKPGWNVYHGEKDAECCVPLRAEALGEMQFKNGSTKQFQLTEDILVFKDEKPSEWKFKIGQWYQCPSQEEVSLPSFPESFECAFGMTSLSGNFSTSGYMWYDGENDQLRLSGSKEGKRVTRIYWESERMKFKIEEHKCKAHSISKSKDWFGNGKRGLISPNDLFLFGEDYALDYMGQRHIRGVLCDHWFMNMTRKLGVSEYSFGLHWYFSAESWKNKDTAARRVPVRCEAHGEKRQLRPGSTAPDEEELTPLMLNLILSFKAMDKQFHHIYDFFHFLPREIEQWVFDPSLWTTGCEDYSKHHHNKDKSNDDYDDTGVSVSALIGITVTAGVLGLIMGAVLFLMFGKYHFRPRHHMPVPMQ